MTQTIHVLPDHVANQIAAGEVIQRPASVVKELMENAVDAGASQVEVHVLDAGRTSIQVMDNGAGMSAEDARVCFTRHATSKLSTAEDLFALATKGFRGEALASIAAIAQVEVNSCQAEAEVGIAIRCHGSELMSEEPKARAVGSTFHVKNLFYNVPARRNFLKSDAVELRHVVDEFQRVAFAHPDVAFVLTHQGNNLFQLKPGTTRQRIVGILGPKHDERLVPVQEETDVVTVEGFVGKPDSARRSRGEQFLFVNGRFVKHGLLHRAILRAYEGLIADGQHPLYALYLTVDPTRVDVNIHPTKIEVKFEEEQPLLAIVKSAVKRGLGAHNVAPSIDFDADAGLQIPHLKPGAMVPEPEIRVNPHFNPFESPGRSSSPSMGEAHGGWSRPSSEGWKELYQVMESPGEESPKEESPQPDFEGSLEANGLDVLQWKGKYLIVPTDGGLTMVHMRRAHMRILFEQFLVQTEASGQKVASQALLLPEQITLTKAEVMALVETKTVLASMGMDLAQVDETTVELKAVPADLKTQVREALDAVLATYHDGLWESTENRGVLWAKAWAQQAAMSSTERLQPEVRRQLIQSLWACEQPHVDPMGRSTMVTLTDTDLETPFL